MEEYCRHSVRAHRLVHGMVHTPRAIRHHVATAHAACEQLALLSVGCDELGHGRVHPRETPSRESHPTSPRAREPERAATSTTTKHLSQTMRRQRPDKAVSTSTQACAPSPALIDGL